MRLKVLYTFDNESKTNCLARWPHVLDIQTAYLDERTPIGVIELKTCIQAIVSASPELVAQLGKDYTVYAYDYSEYETPLVGQGMLSWVLANSSPTPDAPAHQSKTMVTGRVCKNPLGLFSKGAQETLEVKLRLVPVPTVKQNEYLGSMQKYRESSTATSHDFDTQSWTNFMRQNPALMEASRHSDRVSSPMNHSGIEHFHQLLSEGATPREFSSYQANESVRSVSPTHSFGAPSRVSTPGGMRSAMQQQQQYQASRQAFPSSDMIRPSSSASMRDVEFQGEISHQRRDSIQSGYGSGGEDAGEPQQRKRAKLYQANWPGKSDMNIERQPSSLRVAASTAASVRIHRPTPVNPSIAAEQSHDDPIRPPTPISRPGEGGRRIRLPSSSLRESSTTSNTHTSSASPYFNSDDVTTDQTAHSPDDARYQGLFEPPFTMPSSPPILDSRLVSKSSPVLPPISLDTDSGFMSGGLEDYMDDDAGTPVEDRRRTESRGVAEAKQSRSVRAPVQANSPASALSVSLENADDAMMVSEGPIDQSGKSEPACRPNTSSGSRPSSRASSRPPPKPLAPAPMGMTGVQHSAPAIPASDPVVPTHPPLQHSQTWSGPMSDFSSIEMEPQVPGSGRSRKAGANKRCRQIQMRLDHAIKSGQVPPYCENCGSIETPTWRRAWSKVFDGNQEDASEMMKGKDASWLCFEPLERDADDQVCKFKIYKKNIADDENDWVQVLLCNPCGLWLHKFKYSRPENKWNKQTSENGSRKKKKLPVRNRRRGGPLSTPSTRTRSKVGPLQTAALSPAPTEASSIPGDEGITPNAEETDQGQDDDTEYPPSKRRRANSAEPPRSNETAKDRWERDDPMEALRRAIQSSPARNMENRKIPSPDENNLTPKPVRRALFGASGNDGPLKELGSAAVNSCSPRRSPRIATRDEKQRPAKENNGPAPNDDLDGLFESPSVDFELPVSPTPRRRHARPSAVLERRLSLPCNSPTSSRRKAPSATSTPTRLTAERLQWIQEGHESVRSSPHRQASPNKDSMPALPDAGLQSGAIESLDGMIMNIFDDIPGQSNPFQVEDMKFDGDNWANWLPSDYVSPAASDDGPEDPENLINALLSDTSVLKENLMNPKFNPFNFAETDIPDSGFFSSDALNADQQGLATKLQQPSNLQSDDQHAASPPS
ncbi:hypothetical protein N7492_010565 [Penicillium capsulatum]|uniref:Ams2/SPT21 N-terminal domain-containing protein n=1 Tax=Penicillium capsulatum TaxID=69766 RepID=A0A9W9LFK3_9EURO|nr:hypothetical protein N7492_010565 [Penicillium capsulatum]